MPFRNSHKLLFMLLLAVISIGLTFPQVCRAQHEEQQVKAAILYNFAKFVTWPEESFADQRSPLVIAIVGDDALLKRLESLEGKLIGNRAIAIRHFSRYELQRTKREYHILYVAASERKRLDIILDKVVSSPILTVSDLQNFARKGGTLNFEKSHNRIRFAINLDASNRSGLKISSKLFPLASTIIKDGQKR